MLNAFNDLGRLLLTGSLIITKCFSFNLFALSILMSSFSPQTLQFCRKIILHQLLKFLNVSFTYKFYCFNFLHVPVQKDKNNHLT